MNFRISGTEFPIPIVSGIPDSEAQDSRFTVKISQIPESDLPYMRLYTLLCDNIQFYNNYNKSRNSRALIARKLLSKTVFRLKASPGLLRPAESVKMESIKKLNNFNFQRAPIRTFSSELFHTTYYIYSP